MTVDDVLMAPIRVIHILGFSLGLGLGAIFIELIR